MLGENLRKIREQLNLSIPKMAEKLDMSPNTLSAYERNLRMPSMELAIQLYAKLNINTNWFVSGAGEMFNKNSQPLCEFEEVKDKLLVEVRKMLVEEGLLK